MRVDAISGLGDKAPACFLVETGGARLLLDLGRGAPPDPFPDLSGVGPIDAILVSHGHDDHIGALHLAAAVGDPPVYATATTMAFAGHPALAGARALPLRGETEVAGVAVSTGRAGHAAGGVWIRVGGEDGVLYTGDLSRESLLYPSDPPPRAATLIADASYGTHDVPLSQASDALLARARSGPLLLPLPPTGRGIEIAVLLHEAGLPIAVCACHRRAAEIMLAAVEPILAPGGADRIEAMLAAAEALDADAVPHGAMLAAPGSAGGGVAGALFERFLGAGVAVLFTGHMEPGTAAARAVASGTARFLRWNVHPRLRDLRWLLDRVRPRRTLLAFCAADRAEDIRTALGLPQELRDT